MDKDDGVLAVHVGRAANCSSLGSIVDVLFVSSVAGAAVLAALAVLKQQKASQTNPEKKPLEKTEKEADEDPR